MSESTDSIFLAEKIILHKLFKRAALTSLGPNLMQVRIITTDRSKCQMLNLSTHPNQFIISNI